MNAVREAWEKFWFEPRETSTLAVFRIAYGLVMLVWAATLGPDIMTFFTDDGILPQPPAGFGWTLLGISDSPVAVGSVYALLLLGSIMVLVGYKTRLGAAVLFVALFSFQQRNPFLENGGDGLLRLLGLYLLFAPAGVALSIDRWRRHRAHFWEFPARPVWALRLVQIQVSVMYAVTVWIKVQGISWNTGTAVGYATRITEYVRFPMPEFVVDSLLLVNLMTWGTLVIELALAFLVWNRRLRPWVLLGGVALHLSTEITLKIGFFSWAVFVSYIAFIPEDSMKVWILRLRDRWRRRRTELTKAETRTEEESAVFLHGY